MKILHLFSNSKWTGPAEPALNLCLALREAGAAADFACAPGSDETVNKIVETARDRGLEPVLRFRLAKHYHPLWNFLDSRSLAAYLRVHPYDLVHCHLDNDHRIAQKVCRASGIPLVRSSYYGEGFPQAHRYVRLLAGADLTIEPSRIAKEHDQRRFHVPDERLAVIPVGIDTERFDPKREVPDARRWLRIPPDAFVVGIVARMQRHRKFEDFFAAMRSLINTCTNAHVIVVGRGTRQKQVGFEPARRLGIEDRVHFAGYVDGENYVGMLKAFDVQVMLVPGSDGTCRAVREAMAMAKPVVAARRGMLPELVQHEVTGLLCDGSPQDLCKCLIGLARDRQLAHALGRAARAAAEEGLSLDTQARSVLSKYEEVLGLVGRGTR